MFRFKVWRVICLRALSVTLLQGTCTLMNTLTFFNLGNSFRNNTYTYNFHFLNYDCNHFGPHRSDFCAQLFCSISAFDVKKLVFLGCLQYLCQNNLFWNTSFQSVLRQNHFYWLATNKIYWFCRCLRLKNGDALAKGRISGRFLKTVRNMTTFWDFSATWFFSVAPQFVQALSVLFSSGCSWLSSCCCSHCLGLVCDWCVWDSDIAKKHFTFEFVLFWAFSVPFRG